MKDNTQIIKQFREKFTWKFEGNQYWMLEGTNPEEFEDFLTGIIAQVEEETQQDIQSVLYMIEGTEERHKIANYIREYMLKK